VTSPRATVPPRPHHCCGRLCADPHALSPLTPPHSQVTAAATAEEVRLPTAMVAVVAVATAGVVTVAATAEALLLPTATAVAVEGGTAAIVAAVEDTAANAAVAVDTAATVAGTEDQLGEPMGATTGTCRDGQWWPNRPDGGREGVARTGFSDAYACMV
jgi:hypothetical protein